MFEIDERFPAGRAVRDRRRGLALRLQEDDPHDEGQQFRFARGGKEYVLFATVSRMGPGKRTMVFHIDQGNLTSEFAGMLAVFARQWLMTELTESFKAYGRLVFGGQVDGVQVVLRTSAESAATLKELLAALVGLRRRHPVLLDEIYATFEAGRALSNNQFAELLRALKTLDLRRQGASYRAASEVLPHVVIALNGPFGRRAPNFVRAAMNRTMWALAVLTAMLLWAAPYGWRVLSEVGAGQLQRQSQFQVLVELFSGALSLAVVGAVIYCIAVMVRLARRERTLSYIRAGTRTVRAP